MDFTRKTYPHFHQAAIATALTLSVLSPAAWSAECSEYPAAPLTVNITGESDDFCDDQVSLREAIIYANDYLVGKDAVTFASALKGKTIEASDGYIYVRESISIAGIDDADLITLKAVNEAPLFYIESFEDRIDFDLSHVILEKSSGANHLIEMNGYGGDVNLDNIHTTDATRAYGVFSGVSRSSVSGENDLKLTLKNSSISGSTFEGNVLKTISSGTSHISIIDSEVTNNLGGGLADSNSTVEIKRSTLSGNTLSKAVIYVSGTIDIIESTINENETRYIAHSYGYYSDAHLNISKSTISGNKVGTILRSESEYESSHLNISDSIISGNTISYYGAATSGNNNSINIQDSILCDNITDYGGDVPGQYPLINASNTNLNLIGSSICNNMLPAINIETNNGATANIENSRVSGNNSGNGSAGIRAKASSSSSLNLNIISSSIDKNTGLGGGGGIDVIADGQSELNLNIQNTTISENDSWSVGGISASPSSDSQINIGVSNSTITKNDTSSPGAGIYVRRNKQNTSIHIQNSIVANNNNYYGNDHDLHGAFTVESSLIGDNTTRYGTTINDIVIDQIGDGDDQTPDTGNNILGQDPLLQDLSLSGGTWVHQLTAESPAVNAGDAQAENLTEFDQRGEGFARVRTTDTGPELDLGAVQYFANPVAVNDAVAISLNSENNLIDVVANDEQNSDGLPLDSGSVTIMVHPENGTAAAQQDGSISYTPNADFVGEDSLIYMLQDIAGNNSTEATVTITVSESSGDSGGPLNLWFISLLAVFGLRRNKHLKTLSK